MGKIKKALVTLGLAALVGSGVFYGGRESQGKNYCPWGASEESFTERQKEFYQRKLKMGKSIADLIEDKIDGCDYARAHLFPVTKKNRAGEPLLDSGGRCVLDRYDLLIGCYETDSDGRRPLWRINLDGICQSMVAQDRWLWGILRIGDYVIVETAKGGVIMSPDIKASVGEALTKEFGKYSRNNGEVCEDVVLHHQQHLDPAGRRAD